MSKSKRRVQQHYRQAVPVGKGCAHPCPECGGVLRLKQSRHGLFYGCDNFPDCRGTHGAHPDGHPMGTPANAVTKKLRIQVHDLFDQLWKGPGVRLSRGEAYRRFAHLMALPRERCHVGMFDREQCLHAIRVLTEFLKPSTGEQHADI